MGRHYICSYEQLSVHRHNYLWEWTNICSLGWIFLLTVSAFISPMCTINFEPLKGHVLTHIHLNMTNLPHTFHLISWTILHALNHFAHSHRQCFFPSNNLFIPMDKYPFTWTIKCLWEWTTVYYYSSRIHHEVSKQLACLIVWKKHNQNLYVCIIPSKSNIKGYQIVLNSSHTFV